MADIGVTWTLTTLGGTIIFNNGSFPGTSDMLYLTEVGGIGAPALRTPTDLIPLGDGAIVHPYWRGARHITMDGVVMVQSTPVMNSIVVIRNSLEDDLIDALEGCLRADGTLSYSPQGSGARTWTVRYEVGVEFRHVDNYLLESFSFGLIAADPDWSGSS